MNLWLPLILFLIGVVAALFLRVMPPPTRWWTSALRETLPVALAYAAGLCAVYAFPALVGLSDREYGEVAWGSAAFFALPVALSPGRLRAWACAFSLASAGLLVWADAIYWRFFQGLIPLAAGGSAKQIWDTRESILELMTAADIALLPLALLGPPCVWSWKKVPAHRWRIPVVVSLATTTLSLMACAPVVRDVDSWLGHRFSWKVFHWDSSVNRVGFITTHVRDFARTLRERRQMRELDAAEYAALEQTYAQRAILPQGEHFGIARGRNVLVVQVEALQEWAIDATVFNQEVTPFLNELKRERALYFENVWDQTGGSPTSDCEFAVLNSHHPLDRGSVAFRRADNDFVAVPGLLAQRGYTTYSAHAYERGMWNRAVVHPRYGFSQSHFRRDFGPGPKIGWGLSDKEFFRRLVSRLGELPAPFFAFAITLSSHHPYRSIPGKERTIDVKDLGKEQLGGYLWSMRYIDEAIRQLFTDLDKAGLLQDTVVMIYGDHDSKLTFREPVVARAKQALNVDEASLRQLARRDWRTKKVPFFLVLPEGAPQGVVSTVGGQVDLGPTLLHYLGVPRSPAFLGQALLGQAGVVVRHDGSAASNEHVWLGGTDKGPRCFALAGEARPDDECRYLQDRASQELDISWTVTLQNLATRLHNSGIAAAPVSPEGDNTASPTGNGHAATSLP